MIDQTFDLLLPRITVITGHYGSGKTEIAINLARKLQMSGKQVAIADLDVINPYFRSREVHSQFDKEGITLIAPKGELANADLPIVSGEIYKYISNPDIHLIIDVGGDKDGALATGQYAKELSPYQPEVFFVVNTNRPQVSHARGIIETVSAVEQTLRLPVTSLINNTNLGIESTWENIQNGHFITKEAAEQLGISYPFSCIMLDLLDEASRHLPNHPWFGLERFMKLPWE